MSTAKRIFLYLVCLVGLALATAGVIQLLRLVLDLALRQSSEAIGGGNLSRGQLSLSLAMLLIGGGLWLGFWRAIQNSVQNQPSEAGTAFRQLFLNSVQLVSVLVFVSAGMSAVQWLLAGAPLDVLPSQQLASFVSLAVVWYYHWRIAMAEGQPMPVAQTLRRWYVYIISAWGLILASTGLVGLINNLIIHLPVWQPVFIYENVWNHGIQVNIAHILGGGLAWGWFWFNMTSGDSGSILRQVYLYLLAIAGSVIAGLTAVTTTLFRIISYTLGIRAIDSPNFQLLGWAIPTMLVAATIWFYHQSLVQEETAEIPAGHLSARRIYYYLMSFISLGTMVAGLIGLLGILVDLLINAISPAPFLSGSDWWRTQLSVSLALTIVGAPLWLYFWGRVLRFTATGGLNENRARSRRVFLYLILAIAVITLAADMVNIAYRVFNTLLQGWSISGLQGARWSLQTLIVAAPLLVYFWQLVRQDQRLGAENSAPPKSVTVLAGENAVSLLPRLEAILGYRIKSWRLLGEAQEDRTISDEELAELAHAIQRAPGKKVLLLMARQNIDIVPFEEK